MLVLLLGGCLAPHVLESSTVTQVREQSAMVMAPDVPMGFGPALPREASSLSLGGGYTAAGVADDSVGQYVLPLSGVFRGAQNVAEGLELVSQGSLGPDVEPGVPGLRGVLGRGTVGLRMLAPLEAAEWGFALDLGAEATYVGTTDTVTTPRGTTSETRHRIRTVPHARAGTHLRIPIAAGLSAMGGVQVQTWPVYWSSHTQAGTDPIDVSPSQRVAVTSPTAGLTLGTPTIALHGQAFVNAGSGIVQMIPWGAAVVVELRTR